MFGPCSIVHVEEARKLLVGDRVGQVHGEHLQRELATLSPVPHEVLQPPPLSVTGWSFLKKQPRLSLRWSENRTCICKAFSMSTASSASTQS